MRKEWKATAIIKNRLNGLRLDAQDHNTSVGRHLDFLLAKCGILEVTDKEYRSEINKLHKKRNK